MYGILSREILIRHGGHTHGVVTHVGVRIIHGHGQPVSCVMHTQCTVALVGE